MPTPFILAPLGATSVGYALKNEKVLVRGGGFEPHSANDAEGPEEFDVINISKLKNIDE
ncbi:MAG: hypothetical protein ACE1ZE_04490 [Candidatus Binatia bacterium]